MRMFSVIAVGLILLSASQLGAQMTDPFNSPFGPNSSAATSATPANPDADLDRRADEAALAAFARSQPIFVGADTPSYARIYRALDSETSFDYLNQPFKDVVDDISFSNKIPIIIDTQALDDHGIDKGTPITRQLKSVTLRSALRLLLRELGLTYVICDEVLQITTPEGATANPSIRLYPVSELLPPNGDGKALVELIKTVVAPDTWCGSDAAGSIIFVEHLETLAIRQTEEAFQEIDELLAAARQLNQNQRCRLRAPGADPFD